MSNYELHTEQMQELSGRLNRLLLDLSMESFLLRAHAYSIRGESRTVSEIKTNILKYEQKLMIHERNVMMLHDYNSLIIEKTRNAELDAVCVMRGYSQITRKMIKFISGVLGPYAVVEPTKNLIEFFNYAKEKYNEIEQAIIDKTSISGNWKAEYDYQHGEAHYGDENAYINAEYTIGHADAYANYEGSIFTKDKNGNLILNPQFQAAAGFTVTAFSAAVDAGYGNEIYGGGVSGDITAGQVSANIGASTGIFDKQGNLNPNLHLNANLEAVAVEAHAEARQTILGTDIKGKASVKVGAGAHANVDIGDGKISVDIGASIGIGASISLEIDYSGTVDAVKGFAEGCWKSISKGAKKWLPGL